MALHTFEMERADWDAWIAAIRNHGYEADYCPVCGLVCVAKPGRDAILEGIAQVVLDTDPDSPTYRSYIGQNIHAGCPDVIMGLSDAPPDS